MTLKLKKLKEGRCEMTYDSPAHGKINPYVMMREVDSFTLTSADIQHGEPLPAEIYADYVGGKNLSPQLSWSDFPAATKSFAITCYDPDAPTGSGFWHWAVVNIPASVTSLDQGAGALGGAGLPEGAIMLPNEMRSPEFTGSAPPEGTGVHHYWFAVHALSEEHIDIDPQSTPAVLGFTIRDMTLARAVIVATAEFGGAEQ